MLRSLATSAVALIAAAAPALSEVTPAQAWENLNRYYEDFGYQVTTGGTNEAGDTLTVTNTVLTMQSDAGTTSVNIPQMTFQQTGDAKVRAVFNEDVTFATNFTAPEAEGGAVPVTVAGRFSAPGNEMLISGSDDDMLYEYNYPTARFETVLPSQPVAVTLTGLQGKQRNVRNDTGTEATFDGTVTEMTLQLLAEAPENSEAGPGKLTLDMAMTNLAMQGVVAMPAEQFDMSVQMPQALAAGFRVDGDMSFGGATGTFAFAGTDAETGAVQEGSGKFGSGASEYSFAMSADGMRYDGKSADQSMEVSISDLPFPITYAVKEASGGILMPLVKKDDPQPFRLAYILSGLTLSDGIWALFDPTGQLPRDPANLAVDVEGETLVIRDLTDPALNQPQTDASGMPVEPEVPFQPKSLKINRIALDAVGAGAEVTGALEFGDTPDQPVGRIEGTFQGVNGLMDKLVAMGILPQDQVMAARMMMAMFARPVEGEADKLATELEFREGGQIFANGQQVK